MTRINLVQTRRLYNITSAEFSLKFKDDITILNLSSAAVGINIKEELEKTNTNYWKIQ